IEWGDMASGRDDDPDGDGLSNYEEFLAGTDPLDNRSLLRVTSIKPSDEGIRIFWDSVPGKIYAVEYAQTLSGVWSEIENGIVAENTETSVLYPSGDSGFFRVVIYLE
ncbi:MAG: hypothetical protein GX804_07275, partial [Lentisphaerae bacterium]|nr:hypothetical protein [Lentisphaerota bacterium]